MRRMVLALAGLLVVGCAASNGNVRTVVAGPSDEDDKLICREETPTGTSIPRRICRTPLQIEEERRAAVDLLATPRRAPRP